MCKDWQPQLTPPGCSQPDSAPLETSHRDLKPYCQISFWGPGFSSEMDEYTNLYSSSCQSLRVGIDMSIAIVCLPICFSTSTAFALCIFKLLLNAQLLAEDYTFLLQIIFYYYKMNRSTDSNVLSLNVIFPMLLPRLVWYKHDMYLSS